jgi:hypothetical protein
MAEMATRPCAVNGTLTDAVPLPGIRTTFQNPVGLSSFKVGDEINRKIRFRHSDSSSQVAHWHSPSHRTTSAEHASVAACGCRKPPPARRRRPRVVVATSPSVSSPASESTISCGRL